MSWGFAYQGKPSAVKAKIEEQSNTFSIPEEQKSFDGAKASILATLDGRDDSRPVFVSASGGAYTTTTGKNCEVFISVKDYPIAQVGASMGTWV